MIKLGDVHYQTKQNLLFFSERDLINADSGLCWQILLTTDLQRHVFPFGKLLLKVRLCLSVKGIFDDV